MEGRFSCQLPSFSSFRARFDSSAGFLIESFGCKVNQYDAQLLREVLAARFRPAAPGEVPALVLINTCSVTAEADRQGRQALRRARRRFPGARILASGCLARRPDVDLRREGLADAVIGRPEPRALLDALGEDGEASPGAISCFDGRTRAFLKIQDGCDRKCSFCVVPLIRGNSVSRDAVEVTAEAVRLAAAGAPEIVLCGVRLNAYRDSGTGEGLAALVRRLLELSLPVRFRLSSLYPGELEPELINVLTGSSRICRHVHIPVQSGSDAVLKAMGRGYTSDAVSDLVLKLRTRAPETGLTADILVGFPGETDRDHEATVKLVAEAGFSRLHLFPFSARPGTRAAGLSPVTREKVRIRMAELRALDDVLRQRALAAETGRDAEVVIESKGTGDGLTRGTTGNYHRARVRAGGLTPGTLVRVRVTGTSGGELDCIVSGDARG